jgi:hypothetical protein
MHLALFHPKYGFYFKDKAKLAPQDLTSFPTPFLARHDLAAKTQSSLQQQHCTGSFVSPDGDFITSPEVSQLFGEVHASNYSYKSSIITTETFVDDCITFYFNMETKLQNSWQQ